MLKILNKLKRFRLIYPRKFWAAVLLGSLAILATSSLIYARTQTVTKNLNYPACEITYGQDVKAWDGDSDKTWSDAKYHYVVKRFTASSHAPKGIWANVQESTPYHLSTGSLNKNTACQPEFKPTIDTGSANYRWEGSRATAMRLGVPNLDKTNDQGKVSAEHIDSRITESLSPPLSDEDHGRAAAWVDDGGQAIIKPQNKTQKLIWCQNRSHPVKDQSCGEITEQRDGKYSAAGAGYLFTEDNCPEDFDCTHASSWYQPSGGFDLSKIIGVDKFGQLNPFDLYLDALSTYGYDAAIGMNVTFKYPRITEVTNSLALNKKVVNPGDTIKASLNLGKTGPDLTKFEITAVNVDKLDPIVNFKTDNSHLGQLNQDGQTQINASFKVSSSAEPGKCYDIGLSFTATSRVVVEGTKATVPDVKARYCIAKPQSAFTYTYDLTTRGSVKSDFSEFKTQVAQTLASQLGWRKAGVSFRAVSSGGDFTIVLASPDQMTSFSPGCDSTYSCQSGHFVIINDERWRTATPSWNKAGGSLRDYRHMVINHETGHWLGFGHLSCPVTGAPAPVMQQQSISLQGCKFNPWPTSAEIKTLKARS